MTASIRLGPGTEFDLIRRFLRDDTGAARADVLVGPGDDCAVVRGDGIAITVDAAVEGVHFRLDWVRPDEAGYRVATGALSDLAAVGARPIGVLASLLAPDRAVPDTAEALMHGVADAARAVGAGLLGGDVVRSPESLALDVVAIGEAPDPVLRSGASPGDELWVTGPLGGAAAAVAAWRAGAQPSGPARAAFARPTARTAEARWLLERRLPRAMIDLSDGLAGDAAHLAAASGLRIVLDAPAIPIHEAVLEWAARDDSADALRLALGGGEDYELCFAARAGDVAPHAAAFAERFGITLVRVGVAEPGASVALRDADGRLRPLDVQGYRHFES